ncbi:MAG: MFS transporter [Dehalococcoidia bacterium]
MTPGSRRPLYALFVASFISLAGNMMTLLAVPWFVLQTTDSASRTGLAAFFFLLPVPIASVFGGVLVDRLGFKVSSVVADIASGVAVAAIPLLHMTVGLEYWQLLVLVFLGSLLDTPGQTARESMLPELASAGGVSLERATSAMVVIERGARLLGAPLAGGLIALVGAENVLWIDAATFAASAAILGVMIPRRSEARPKEPSSGYLADLAAGWRFLRFSPLLLTMTLTITATNFMDSFRMVLLPVYSDRVLDSAVALGLIYGFSAAGGIAGAIVFGAYGEGWPRLKIFALSFFLSAMVEWLFVFQVPLPLLLAGCLLRGVAGGPANSVFWTVFFERTPAEMRGRVIGIAGATAWLVMPLGVLLGGALVDLVGLTWTLAIVALAYTPMSLVAFVNPWLRPMDERPADSAEARIASV